MITVHRRAGSIADAVAAVRAVPREVLPYAAATALTRTASFAARTAMPQQMRSVFSGPTAFALNSLRIEPANKDKLSARVHVKNDLATGVRPESVLLAEEEGGARRAKRFELALRAQRLLGPGEFAVPGKGATLDANGNVSGAQSRSILSALKNVRAASGARDRKTGKRLRKGRKLANDLFVGIPRNGSLPGSRPDGIWRREGKRLRALFIFTKRAPQYGPRLDFDGTVAQVVRSRFEPEFRRAAADLAAKFAKGARS